MKNIACVFIPEIRVDEKWKLPSKQCSKNISTISKRRKSTTSQTS